MAGAVSFLAQTADRKRALRELCAAVGRVSRPAGGLLFASGRMAEELGELCRDVARAHPGLPLVAAAGASVLTERGEVDDSALAGILWSGGRSEVLAVRAGSADDTGAALARALADRSARTAPAVMVFARPEGFGPGSLEPLQEGRVTPHLFGAGTIDADTVAVDAQGKVETGAASALIARGLAPPVVRASPACRLLMPLRRITETRGALVTRIENEAALDVLSHVGQSLAGEPLILAVLSDDDPEAEHRPDLVIRGIQGVDPVRRALLVSDEVREGMRLAFAVRDAHASRADFAAATREVERASAGALPRFGVFITCAGRGASLYGATDVDTQTLRTRFPNVPFAGMASSFEIAPHAGRPTLQLYTGVVALFSSPS